MYIYVYMYTCIYICIYMNVYIYMYKYIHTHRYTCIYIYIYIYIRVHFIYMYICIHICKYTYMYVKYRQVYIYAYSGYTRWCALQHWYPSVLVCSTLQQCVALCCRALNTQVWWCALLHACRVFQRIVHCNSMLHFAAMYYAHCVAVRAAACVPCVFVCSTLQHAATHNTLHEG